MAGPSDASNEGGLLAHPMADNRSSEESYTFASDLEMDDLEDSIFCEQQRQLRPKWWTRPRTNSKASKAPLLQPTSILRPQRKRSRYRRILRLVLHLPYLLVALLAVTATFFPSYTNPPQRYTDLRQRAITATRTGAANPHNEKIFIVASLYDEDGHFLRGDWGQSLLYLVSILGHDNVFVSIYENDPSDASLSAMTDFEDRLPCPSSVVHERLDTSALDRTLTTDGQSRMQRMAFLAQVRNRALRPLENPSSEAHNQTWDKLLYLNDVVFDPIDAANLLLNTHVDDATGRTDYRAVCAVDFNNPFKFYDTFATRDLEGWEIGIPFFPWFSNGGRGQSRRDVLDQKDAVRVTSCWGGMMAFEAKWFQEAVREPTAETQTSVNRQPDTAAVTAPESTSPATSDDIVIASLHDNLVRSVSDATATPLRFRHESETFWDASECCLIHADIMHAANIDLTRTDDTGIYMNPYIRVAYHRPTFVWLRFTRRFERLYSGVQGIVNWFASKPNYNPRRLEQPGQEVMHQLWKWDDVRNGTKALTGAYADEKVVVPPGMFCGVRRQYYILEDGQREGDGKNWGMERAPPRPAS